MADVAKWLRQWIVTPPFAGSNPVVRPNNIKTKNLNFSKKIFFNILKKISFIKK